MTANMVAGLSFLLLAALSFALRKQARAFYIRVWRLDVDPNIDRTAPLGSLILLVAGLGVIIYSLFTGT